MHWFYAVVLIAFIVIFIFMLLLDDSMIKLIRLIMQMTELFRQMLEYMNRGK